MKRKVAMFLKSAVLIAFVLFYSGCKPEWPQPEPASGESFSMIIASDLQVYWYSRSSGVPTGFVNACDGKSGKDKDKCVEEYGNLTNVNQITSMSNVQDQSWPASVSIHQNEKILPVLGVIVNGDMTAFWHPWQKKEYEKLYFEKASVLPDSWVPLFGLGNHDYSNNVCDCSGWIPWDANSCVRDAIGTSRYWYADQKWITYDDKSLAYSYNIGDFHFVQLNLSPSYNVDATYWFLQKCKDKRWTKSTDDGDYIIKQAYSWLEKDLDTADKSGKYILISIHAAQDTGYWQPSTDMEKFRVILAKYNVQAIFGGHIHSSYGYIGDYNLGNLTFTNKSGRPIPFFRSGASEYNTYLIAEFIKDVDTNKHFMNVGTINSADGGIAFYDKNLGGGDIAPRTFNFD